MALTDTKSIPNRLVPVDASSTAQTVEFKSFIADTGLSALTAEQKASLTRTYLTDGDNTIGGFYGLQILSNDVTFPDDLTSCICVDGVPINLSFLNNLPAGIPITIALKKVVLSTGVIALGLK